MAPFFHALATTPMATNGMDYFIRLWQMGDNGLPENNVTAVIQASDGFLWLGTRSGLARFDGTSFEVFNSGNAPEMRSSHVTCLFEGTNGTLWIGHDNGDVTTYQAGKFSAVPVLAHWLGGKIFAICSDAAGDVWLLNQHGELGRVKDGAVIECSNDRPVHLLAVAKNPRGGFWIQRDTDVSFLDGGKLHPILTNTTTNTYVQGICATHDGGLWVMMEHHIKLWKNGEWAADFEPAPSDWAPSPAMIETRSGYLAVATSDHGLYIALPGHDSMRFCRTNGLSSDWINSMCEDREGNLWVGTGNGGLAMLRAVSVKKMAPPDAWEGRAVLAVDAGKDGRLWMGTEGAGLYSFDGETWTNFTEAVGLEHRYVWSVAPDAPGGIWAGTWGGGVYAQTNGRFERPAGLANLFVAAICRSRTGAMLVGTSEGLLCVSGDRTNWFAGKPDLVSPDVRAVCEAADGTVWFGMSGGGLGCRQNGKVRQYRRGDGLSSDFVQCLHLDEDGGLWIGTLGGGLNRFKDGRFASITKKQGLNDEVICDIEDDGQGNFWISSHDGIMRVNKSELASCANGTRSKVLCLNFGLSDGLPSLECSGGFQPAGCKTADGNLWFPTAKGLACVNPNTIRINPKPPPVVIEEMRVDGLAVANLFALTNELKIPPGHHRLEFDYAGLSYMAPERVRFRYRLDGLDHEWGETSQKRLADFSYIPPGSYVFRVTACNNDGVWSEDGASLAFNVLPYFWQTWWFFGLTGLVAAAAVGGSVLVATRRRMRLKLDRLEHQRAIERERTRIAKDIHDDLGASLTRISMLSQSARSDLTNAPEAAAQVDQICGMARELTRAMDEIVWAVNPEHDSLDSLAIYMGKYAQDYLRSAGVRSRLDIPEELPPWRVTAEVRHNIFLAFKEALNNVVKHSGASEVRVTLTLGLKAFVLSAQDNGRGFTPGLMLHANSSDPDRVEGGHGLANMKLRLEEIGGSFEIQSAPQAGTTGTFSVPLKASRFEDLKMAATMPRKK
ncbi:MAG TPA: two-component regulator propeller domain-containing protein [Verrucomicrobiae bacterium]|nr:two-component regulator propeller domain-containing protein [Verrucomicrobiae bacterium]